MRGIAFEPIRLNNLEVSNRFVNAAAADGLTGKGGTIAEAHIDRITALVRGGTGLILTGGVGILDSGRSGPNTPNMERESAVEEYSRLVRRAHEAGGAIAVQLVHSGVWTSSYQNAMGREAIGASVIPRDDPYLAHGLMPPPGSYHAATDEELTVVADGFAAAALKGKQAGFDAVEVHAAHDSLLAQFMSPITNRRSDRWGGTLENRIRLHRNVLEAIRRKVGDDYPIIVKLGLRDGMDSGLELQDGVEAGRLLATEGVDVLEVSQGLEGGELSETVFRPVPKDGSGYFTAWSRALKKKIRAPVILTGGVRTIEAAEMIIEKGDADMIGLCRPLVREPGLIGRWRSGDRRPAKCISCNRCVFALGKGSPLACQIGEGGPGERTTTDDRTRS